MRVYIKKKIKYLNFLTLGEVTRPREKKNNKIK